MFALVLCGFFAPVTARAQTPGGTPPDSTATAAAAGAYASVKLDNRKLFDVLAGSGLTAAERADKIHRRLVNLILRTNDVPPFSPQDLGGQGQSNHCSDRRRHGNDRHGRGRAGRADHPAGVGAKLGRENGEGCHRYPYGSPQPADGARAFSFATRFPTCWRPCCAGYPIWLRPLS